MAATKGGNRSPMSLSKNLIALQELLALNQSLEEEFLQLVDVVEDCLRKGNKLFIAGNGGSAADANHLAAEFVGGFEGWVVSLNAESLNSDPSVLTAIANDFGYEQVFAMQLQAKARPGDVFLGITTSGNSKNILKAMEWAFENNVTVALLTSGDGGKAKDVDNWHRAIMVKVQSSRTDFTQTIHNVIYHTLIEELINRGLALRKK